MKRLILALTFFTTMLLASASGFAAEYVYCRGEAPSGDAFTDPGFTALAPSDLQYICGLPVDSAVNPRCPAAILSACVVGPIGGDASVPGRHNVPSGGWFEAIATSGSGTPVKCHCGCFAPETLIWTETGEYSVKNLLSFSRNQAVAPMVRSDLDQLDLFVSGLGMRAHNFTTGPESKPLVVIQASNHQTLRLTDTHPVLVLREGQQVFLRADEVVVGDTLLDHSGREISVISVSSAQLPQDQKVINFDTTAKDPLAHIVVANDIQVGDHRWQEAINDNAMREELRKNGDLFYLKLIVEK